MAIGMNDIIEQVLDRSKDGDFASRTAATRAVRAVFDVIKDAIIDGDSVTIYGFGSFKTITAAEAVRKNPQTGESFTVPEHKRVKFKCAPVFKSAVNGDDSAK